MSALNLRVATTAELRAELDAARQGVPYLVYRQPDGRRQVVVLGQDRQALTIGRGVGNDVALTWDPSVSRLHAQLERIGGVWTFSDEGLSRNGSYLNGERVTGMRRLHDRDVILVGGTVLEYRDADEQADPTLVRQAFTPPRLSDSQRRVLLALARPYREPGSFTMPASNEQIAQELSYSVGAVKDHLRAMFHKFGLDALPQNQKRLKLVERAFRAGTISPRDL